MERIRTPKIENVRVLDRFYHWQNRNAMESTTPSTGTLYLTPTHLIFVNPVEKRETWVLLGHIGSVDRLSMAVGGSPLQIRCKTFLSLILVIPKDRDSQELYAALLRLAQPATYEELYCFSYNPPEESFDRTSGWNIFDLQSEYQRIGVPNQHWVLSKMNQHYEVCDTYPQFLYVPSSATPKILLGSAGFRSRGRLPVLSYLYPKTNAAICRCSQPLSGFSARCEEDEEMLNCILRSTPESKTVFIIDTRPRINAMANRATGKGYETEANYVGMKVQFFSIENIHVMRSGLQKLVEVCDLKTGSEDLSLPSHSTFLSGLQATGWLKHIRSILDASLFIAEKITEGHSVLVHCSDGWDRTAQTCSLACLFLDPYYRTLHGFMALIEKEWLAFGHKFSDRAGHLRPVFGNGGVSPAITPSSAVNMVIDTSREQSPVFAQFLDCVWQLLCQKPYAFQFNERFLLVLHDHLYSCQFGTFIGNNEKERRDLKLSERTYSLWGYMKRHLNEYLNPLYDPERCRLTPLLFPDISAQQLRLWVTLYSRFEEGVHPREPLLDTVTSLIDHSSALEDHALYLERRIALLKEMLANPPHHRRNPLVTVTANGAGMSSPHGSLSSISMGSSMNWDDYPNASVIIKSVALDWKPIRYVRYCVCSTPFSQFTVKYHCWKCGDVVCRRCTDTHAPLIGLYSNKPVPVCQLCYERSRVSPIKEKNATFAEKSDKLQKSQKTEKVP
ncbi:myotubularin-related protein 6-like isoform X2 [Paramacrobiotus metropolitanus]|uniref:myotubularin-related protein 6-like isoform X2 n=1 Tax=Paramacrobiotus metropolitanus TaxID=2943436 RepID=UPI0024460853|nr:myotubularin-related protein 6-like isoform X2 [Paramacrobiotus metropolitanus]